MSAFPKPPRRIAPHTGAAAWTGASLPASEYMLPLGAEHAAELAAEADAPAAKLDALATELAGRLDHGRGAALLRGLPAAPDPDAMLRRLGRHLGTPPPEGDATPPDALLLAPAAAAELALVSAAAVHNALLGADRAALAALYEAPASGGGPVFTVTEGVFAGRAEPALLSGPDALPPLAAAMADPELALRLSLRPGDVLALNPSLVWLLPAGEAPMSRLALRLARGHAAGDGA